jgi:photosystem II stability/assembly factor-like uncharacterized protein
MNPRYFGRLTIVSLALVSASGWAQEGGTVGTHVSRMVPVKTVTRTLSAERPVVLPAVRPDSSRVTSRTNTWKLLATLPDAIIHDMVFVTTKLGYAAAEGGQVWKTTDGGVTWSLILNLGDPYYFYGVSAINAKEVVVSGFIDSTTEQEGIIRWTENGGESWSDDLVLSTASLQRVRFAKTVNGLVLDLTGGTVQYTSNGGAVASDWGTVTANSDGAWFGLQFTLLSNLHAFASGINFCSSTDAGAAWTCGPSIDPVFDGPVLFRDDAQGWVGGGEIYPSVAGWVHLTTNGGKTWSGRTLESPWPIRELEFLNASQGWAAGGNIYSGVGGIYFTNDGGNSWSLDVNTNVEMDACDKKPVKSGYQVWCAGYDSSYQGYVYTTVVP